MIFARSFKEDFSIFLKDNALYLCLGVVALIVLTIIIVYLVKRNKKPSKKEEIVSSDFNLWIEYLGGKENIEEISGVGSRLTVQLKDGELLKEDIKSLGVSSIMKMSGKIILVVENSAEKLADNLKKSLQ